MSVTARKINVNFSIDDEKFPVSSLNFKNSVNNIPTATVEFGVKDEQTATRIKNKVFVSSTVNLFEKIFKPSNNKFTEAKVEMINENNSVEFIGILGNVKTTFSAEYVGLSATIFHKYQLFSFIDLSIYALKKTEFFDASNNVDAKFNYTLPNITGSLANRIQQVIKKVANEDSLKAEKNDPAGLEEAKQQHEMNLELLETFYEFLNDSDDEKSEFIGQDLLNNDDGFTINSKNLNSRIVQTLVDSGANLWDGLTGKLLSTFFMDVAMDNSQKGRFYRLDKGKISNKLTAPVVQVSWSGGDMNSQPLAGVLVYDTNDNVFASIDKGTKTNTIVSRYPKEIVAFGELKTIGVPYWMTIDNFASSLEDAASTLEEIEENTSTTVDEIIKKLEKNGEALKVKNIKRHTFANDYAKLHYENLRYKNSLASLKIPFDPSIEPGSISKFVAEGEGTTLFEGYLRTVNHTIKLRNDGAEAHTSLTFNQVGKTFIEG